MGFPDIPTTESPLAWLVFLVTATLGVSAAVHALLFKRHPRAAFGWIITALFVPIAGPLVYAVFGVNRVGKRAQKYARDRAPLSDGDPAGAGRRSPAVPDRYAVLDHISASVTQRALVEGNSVDVLHNGEEAYPAMLAAIDAATTRVHLCSYIFDSDTTGQRFVDALARAHDRGVEVRVLVDGVGEWYGRPRIGGALRSRGVPFARFLAPALVPPTVHINLRNHRKVLVIDDDVAFTGGMNIGDRHLCDGPDTAGRHRDLHFALRGPIVEQLDRMFVGDWRFATGEELTVSQGGSPGGSAHARVIVDGPDLDLDKLLLVLLGAISTARESIRILTPYFIPPRELLAALHAAALRGVEVEIVIPERCNLPFVRWATHHLAWEPLQRGVAIFEHPGTFSHAKLIVIDDHYVQIGSANIDDRSLRLNFEVMVEVYDPAFGTAMAVEFARERDQARRLTLVDVDGRSVPRRVRDGFFWLFSPYL